MLEVNSTKRKFFRVILGLVTILAIAAPAGARGGGGGHGGGFSGGGHFSGGSHSSGGSSRGSFSSSRFEGAGHEMQSPPQFSRTDSFSRGRIGNESAARFESSNSRFSNTGRQFDRGSFNRDSFAGLDRAAEPQRFAESRDMGAAQAPHVSRESIMQPMTRSAHFAQSTHATVGTSRIAVGGHSRVFSTSGSHQTAFATTNRMSIMRPLSATASSRFTGGSRTFGSGSRSFIGSNQTIASNFSGHHSFNNTWGHNNWSNNNWGHNNWRHGSWWHKNNHHRHFDNDDVFVVVGGFWPWWGWSWWWPGWYPYYWYPYYGYPYYGYPYYGYPGDGATYNYYNYYDGANGALQPGSTLNGIQVPDYGALSAVGKKTQGQPETQSDKLFDEGVKAFGSQDYATAVDKFQAAVRLEPEDTVLPFAYAQALFANNQYEQAAAVLTTTLAQMEPQKPEISYPAGLYKDESILNAQIENLHRAVLMDPTNAQLQLLYGYQLLGIGKTDEAVVPLNVAKRDARTVAPASALLEVLEHVTQPSAAPAK